MALSLENIYTIFEAFANNHLQIRSFGCGAISDIEDEINNVDYAKLWAYYNSSNVTPIQYNSGTQDYIFNILLMDILDREKVNEEHIHSDMNQIARDLIVYLQGLDFIDLNATTTITPFTEEHSEWLAGVQMQLTLTISLNTNECDIPLVDNTILCYTGDGCGGLTDCTDSITAAIAQLQEDVAQLQASLSMLQSEFTVLNDLVYNLITIVDNIGTLINDLQGQIDQINININDLSNSIDAILIELSNFEMVLNYSTSNSFTYVSAYDMNWTQVDDLLTTSYSITQNGVTVSLPISISLLDEMIISANTTPALLKIKGVFL